MQRTLLCKSASPLFLQEAARIWLGVDTQTPGEQQAEYPRSSDFVRDPAEKVSKYDPETHFCYREEVC